MFYALQNKKLKIASGKTMNYVAFGHGKKPLVIIPGLGDALKTVDAAALPLAFTYRLFNKEYRVHLFSRVNELPTSYSTAEMASDTIAALKELGIKRTALMGVSMGGMISEHIAAMAPDMVEKLLLVVTAPCPGAECRAVVGKWLKWAREGDYKSLVIDTAEKTYTEKYLKKNRWLYPFMKLMGKPKSFQRFITQAEAILAHDATEKLAAISAPTLVIGGEEDKIVGGGASRELAAGIRGSKLYMYENYGHSVYEEAPDFNQRVLEFLSK